MIEHPIRLANLRRRTSAEAASVRADQDAKPPEVLLNSLQAPKRAGFNPIEHWRDS